MSGFEKNYLFTTENISGYMETMDVKDKSLLTVGSSMDQAFNAILNGAKEVTVMDINPNLKEFLAFKKELLLKEKTILDFYNKVISCGVTPTSSDLFGIKELKVFNDYMRNEDNFSLLKQRIKDVEINCVVGNIFDMKTAIGDLTYDRIILSNILEYEYINTYCNRDNCLDFIYANFNEWISHLNKNGILQMLYIYSYGDINMKNTFGYSLMELIRKMDTNLLFKEEFDSLSKTDAIIGYQKTI